MERNPIEQFKFEMEMQKARRTVVELTNGAAANINQLNALIDSEYFTSMDANELAGTAAIMEFTNRLQNKMLWNIESEDLQMKMILAEALGEIAIEGVISGEMRETIKRLNNLQVLVKAISDEDDHYRKKINVAIAALEEALSDISEDIREKSLQKPGSQDVDSLLRMMTHMDW